MSDSKQEDGSFVRGLVLGQIEGKNRAIHAYDGMIWRVRAGVLTLLFAAWGVLLSALGAQLTSLSVGDSNIGWLIGALWALSLSLAIGGFVVDLNYVRRKFRVIHAMRELFQHVQQDPSGDFASEQARLLLETFLDISGDNGSKNYRRADPGYSEARMAAVFVYSFPLAGVTIAGALVLVGLG